MPFVPQPFGPEETLASLDETTPIAGLERREAERAITEWEEERRRLGRELALMTLNTSDMMGKKWSHRFIIAVGPTVEYSSFLFYGAKFTLSPWSNSYRRDTCRCSSRAASTLRCAVNPSGCRARSIARMGGRNSTGQHSFRLTSNQIDYSGLRSALSTAVWLNAGRERRQVSNR